MIEVIANSDAMQPQQAKPVARDDIAPGFSFSAAMIALEGRASTSLQTFGAAPSTEMPGQNARTPLDSDSDTIAVSPETTSRDAAAKAPRGTEVENPKIATGATLEAQQTPQQPAPAPSQSAATSLIAAALATAIPARQSATARAESAALRDTTLAKAAAPKAPRPVQQAPSSVATQNFAQFLAKKLHGGATSFELRLDPPQLGRVDAHMTVGDDGEAVVTLRFENQTALDLFARDEAGLRIALSASGHEFDQHQFTFSLRDQIESENSDADLNVMAATAYEPVFIASYSTGAVDLRL